MFNATRLWGPAIAGIIVAAAGEAWCFLINGVSYLASLAALFMMRLPSQAACDSQGDFWTHWKDGLAYAFGHRANGQMLGLIAIASLVTAPASTMMPVVALALHGGPRLLGVLQAASAIGAVMGGVAMGSARTKTPGDLRTITLWGAATLAAALMAFTLTTRVWFALCWLAVGGLGFIVVLVASNTWLQLTVPESKRGRMMSLYSLAMLGAIPLGSLLAGFLAERFGLYLTIRCGGFLCLAAVLVVGLGSPGNASDMDTNVLTNGHA
jgi:MFS family permease